MHSEGKKVISETFVAGGVWPGPPLTPGIACARGSAQPYARSARGWLGVVCSNGAKSIDELGRTVLCIKLSQCKLRVSI